MKQRYVHPRLPLHEAAGRHNVASRGRGRGPTNVGFRKTSKLWTLRMFLTLELVELEPEMHRIPIESFQVLFLESHLHRLCRQMVPEPFPRNCWLIKDRGPRIRLRSKPLLVLWSPKPCRWSLPIVSSIHCASPRGDRPPRSCRASACFATLF